MLIALIQTTSSDDPRENLARISARIREAANDGATFILTPEVSNCVSMSRSHQEQILQLEADDLSLSGYRALAGELGVWLLIGSLALKTGDVDGRFANRSFLIDPSGEIVARYDKIHMFDVDVNKDETYRESDGYRPGAKAVVAPTPFGDLGLSICYDLRFAYLYRALAQAGAEILTVPAAFSPVTGKAHWESLLRARAIETGCYVLAPAQTGQHSAGRGKERQTYGHSLVISPWGEVLADGGTEERTVLVEIDRSEVAQARRKIAALCHDREFEGP
ncbi:putative amidohydrolase [Planktotalea frisia]|jgi:predicted amidohydrolase|uniref:2-oxoglutaramate amidase n=1 Tax=Planktotalea frisia TaxID=696762 RepID=A0A1L9P058_9RHOB|nr:carbon-nitrogen hydrolase family protein [Planktotalea frisia]OJI94925.1 2-oxoglutaramate amidase [Planktotalea frisia]PZX31396.1 putative amidohydrolase [Planktotalea frisia]